MPKLKRKAALHVKDIKSQIDKHQRIVIKDNNFITGEIRVLRRSLGDIKDQFRVTFENSELERMKRLLPLHEMAVNFGLVSNHPFYTDATCYESEMRYPTDQKPLFGHH